MLSSLLFLFVSSFVDWMVKCRGPLNYHGNEMQIAALLGRVLSQHVNYLKVTAWFLWQAIQQRNGGGWGGVQMPLRVSSKTVPRRMKTFFVMRQLTQWWKPGSIPMKVEDACGSGVIASYNRENQYLSITVSNQKYHDVALTLNTEAYDLGDNTVFGQNSVEVYRTSSNESYARIDQYFVTVPVSIDIVALGLSVTTVVLHGVRPAY